MNRLDGTVERDFKPLRFSSNFKRVHKYYAMILYLGSQVVDGFLSTVKSILKLKIEYFITRTIWKTEKVFVSKKGHSAFRKFHIFCQSKKNSI